MTHLTSIPLYAGDPPAWDEEDRLDEDSRKVPRKRPQHKKDTHGSKHQSRSH